MLCHLSHGHTGGGDVSTQAKMIADQGKKRQELQK